MLKSVDILRFQGSLLCISVAGIATDIRLPKKLFFLSFFFFLSAYYFFSFFLVLLKDKCLLCTIAYFEHHMYLSLRVTV